MIAWMKMKERMVLVYVPSEKIFLHKNFTLQEQTFETFKIVYVANKMLILYLQL